MTKKKIYEYEDLAEQKIKLAAKAKGLSSQIEVIKQERHTIDLQMKEIDEKIDSITSDKIILTDAALLQYLRIGTTLEIDVVEKRIKDTLKNHAFPGVTGNYPIGQKLRAVIKNNVVEEFQKE